MANHSDEFERLRPPHVLKTRIQCRRDLEMCDGRIIENMRPHVVINGGGAGYFSEDDEIDDFHFHKIRSLSRLKRKAKR